MLKELEQLKLRYKKARAKADMWAPLFEACYHYTVPSRNMYYWTGQYQGAQKNAKVFDSTGIAALRNFVSKMQAGLCPTQTRWFLHEAGEMVPEEAREQLNKDLQRYSETIYYYLRKSNFDVAVAESFFDLGIGTGCLICNPGNSDDNPLEFYSVPLARVALEETITNTLETNYRWWDEVRIEDVMELWPKARLTSTMIALYQEDKSATIKTLVEGTIYFPNNPPKKRYRYVVFSESDSSEFMLDEWLESSPWIVFRWSKINNEILGRGPVVDALPSIMTLNELMRLEFASANFNVARPMMAYSDGVFNPWTMRLEANSIIPVAPNAAGQWPIQPFPDTSPPTFVQTLAVDLRQQINTLLFANPIGQPQDQPTRTATEMMLRQRNLAEEIGASFTRLQNELLAKVLHRVSYILEKRGLIEQIKVDNRLIKLSYKSPLVIAQGQQDVQNFINWFQLMQGVQGPEAALINLKPERFPHWSASKMGVDTDPIVGEQQLAQFLSQQSEKSQEQEMMMMEAQQSQIQAQQQGGGNSGGG